MREMLLKRVVDYYLESGGFNGITVRALAESLEMELNELRRNVKKGVQAGRIRILSSCQEMNPHIIRFGFREEEAQIACIEGDGFDSCCIYPAKEVLRSESNVEQYNDRPFSRMLAEGAGQLETVFFELDLLELYRRDARYYYQCNDVGGSICIVDKFCGEDSVAEKDKILLEAFGFAFDDEENRFVVAFVGDVADLSPEHQSIWKSKQVKKSLMIHPGFYESQILGKWPEGIPVFAAVLHEQRIINEMVQKIRGRRVFRLDFGRYLERRPKEFAFLLRPSLKDFQEFVLLLDKLLSENLSREFFKDSVDLEREELREDGKVRLVPKGTITLLDEWLRTNYRCGTWEPWEYVVSVFRKIRKLRQEPAHKIGEDVYDPTLFKQQRELIREVYSALSIFREILSTHPNCSGEVFEIPDAIKEGKIWSI